MKQDVRDPSGAEPRARDHGTQAESPIGSGPRLAPLGASLLDAVSSAVFAISVDAIVCVDASQRIVLFNRGAETIFGYPADEVLGQPLGVLIPEHARRMHARHVEDFGASDVVARRMGERGEITGRRKSGEVFPAEASISRVDVGGKRIYAAVLRDISDRKREEIERASLLEAEREARAAAEAATRARDDVLAVVSHDLQNPLSTISMCASALADDGATSDDAWRELVLTIRQATEWMHRLIQDLLDVASIESGRLALELREESVSDLISHASALLEPTARDRGLTLETFVEPNIAAIRMDAQRVTQVLANLVMNACKFTEAGGRVTISVSRAPAGAIRFAVTDTGCGIATPDIPHVFDRFWQKRQRASNSRRGTGLGLTIARGIVEAHGGTIDVTSERGRGSEFWFTIPLTAAT